MFASDQSALAEYARANGAPTFRRVCAFSLISARVQFSTAIGAFTVAESEGLTAAMRKYGAAINPVRINRLKHLELGAWAAMMQFQTSPDFANLALAYLVRDVPGLGFIKAGFALQMAFGVSGCIDTHNARNFGINARSLFHFQSSKSDRRLNRLARLCNATIEDLGGTESLWDNWCAFMAGRYPGLYANPEHVSSLHRKIIP